MTDHLETLPPSSDAGRGAGVAALGGAPAPARAPRRLSEHLALARFGWLLDEASEWTMWLGAVVPPARLEGRRDLAALREATRGLERWAASREGLLRALGREVAWRVETLLAAARECLRSSVRGSASFQRRRKDLEARLLDLDRVIAENRGAVGRR